jgi:voltage-gated potassium channel
MRVSERSAMVSKSLRDTQVRRDLGVIVLAVRKGGGEMLFNPSADTVIEAGDHLIAMGPTERLESLAQLLTEVSL